MEKKRSIDGYEIKHAVHIGRKEIIFGENEHADLENQFLCAYCTTNALFASYEDGFTGTYPEMMKLFSERIQEQVAEVERERQAVTVPLELITADQCYPNDVSQSIEGKVVAIRTEALRPEYRTADHQLEFVTGGFGAYGNARGFAVFCKNLYSGKTSRWERHDVQGVVKPECLPEWAKMRLTQFQDKGQDQRQKPAEKEER